MGRGAAEAVTVLCAFAKGEGIDVKQIARATLMTVALAVSQTVCAEWRIETRTDSMTDEVKSTVVMRNEAGHSLSFYRLEKAIWMTFRLSDTSLDVLGDPAPMYRVDKHPPVDANITKQAQRRLGSAIPTLFVQEPKWINFRIWHGEGLIGEGLRQFLSGQTVVIRYHLFTGGYRETSFSLVGLGAAMKTAFDIDADLDPSAADEERGLRGAFATRLKACFADHRVASDLDACRAKAMACVKKSRSGPGFDACFADQ